MLEVIQFLTPPFVACTSMLLLFGYLGMHVLQREIIFIDIALAQIAAVGGTFAVVVFALEDHDLMTLIIAFGFTVLASLFFANIHKKICQISQEAIIGVSYAIAAAAALFILALSAGGDVHMEHMLTGSILWASWNDILFCGVLFGAVGLFHWIFRKRFQELSRTYNSCHKRMKQESFWDFMFYLSMGLVITFSVKIAGVLVIFSFLIIPATLSAFFSQSWKKRLFITWGIGIVCILLGLVFSYSLDFSCGPSVVSFLGLALILAAIIKRKKGEVVS